MSYKTPGNNYLNLRYTCANVGYRITPHRISQNQQQVHIYMYPYTENHSTQYNVLRLKESVNFYQQLNSKVNFIGNRQQKLPSLLCSYMYLVIHTLILAGSINPHKAHFYM